MRPGNYLFSFSQSRGRLLSCVALCCFLLPAVAFTAKTALVIGNSIYPRTAINTFGNFLAIGALDGDYKLCYNRTRDTFENAKPAKYNFIDKPKRTWKPML